MIDTEYFLVRLNSRCVHNGTNVTKSVIKHFAVKTFTKFRYMGIYNSAGDRIKSLADLPYETISSVLHTTVIPDTNVECNIRGDELIKHLKQNHCG